MNEMTVGRTVGYGALAGAVAGGVGAAAMYWLVEPSIRAAIALEEAGTPAMVSSGHNHGADNVVTRADQVVFGLVTVVVVGALIGIAFAIVHGFLRSRLPARSAAGSVMVLAALGFVAFTLAPAIIIPANPPAVGDPATVNLRTAIYLGTIMGAVALTAMVTTLAQMKALVPRLRIVAATALGILGTAVLIWALPHAADQVPASVPADLIWDFRVASLAQIGLMWVVLGAVYAYLLPAKPSLSTGDSQRPTSAMTSPTQLTGG